MRNIESKISPLIAGLFPSFYETDGPNFIAFMQAYYEWLEQNFQLLDLEDITNFNVGDTVQQDNVTGTIYSINNKSILVLVEGLETFKCFNICSELIPVTSSSGGSSFILRGGTAKRMGSIFYSRNLSNIRDIDTTLDLFVVRFKEKYLKNIEFDTQTNKRLLVKNSLDLYRSKGTSRSIDLFFRLIYGVQSTVYYPGDDLFRLSDAEWFKPQYIEINSTSVDRAITLVGKQITGVNSGATAFVERYVKKKVNAGFVHAFYISNVRGAFEVNERLKNIQIFPDSPRIVGSLTGATVIDGSEAFQVGDLVNFESVTGLGALGRVTSTVKGSGEVSFQLANSGWGYTANKIGDVTAYTSNTFLSDTILLLANVESGQLLANVNLNTGGTGYNNTDIIYVTSRYSSGIASPTTNTSGSILSVKVLDRGAGFYPARPLETPSVLVVNSTGFSSAGVGAILVPEYNYPKKYFDYLETVTQPLFSILYQNANTINLMIPGSVIEVNDVNNFGKLVEIDVNSNTMIITLDNKSSVSSGDIIRLQSNNQSKVDVIVVSPLNTTGRIISVSNTGIIDIGAPRGTFAVGDTVIQRDITNDIIASATITRTSGLTLTGGFINVSDISGVFRPNANVFILGKGTTTNSVFKTISLSAAITSSSNTFIDTFSPFIYSSNNGLTAFVTSKTAGSNAQYRIASLIDSENVKLNTDRLSNNDLLNTRLNVDQYGLPYSPTANLSSIIFGALAFEGITVGSIKTLGDINPGTGYNKDPIASAFQPFITGYQARDYVFTISNNESSFAVGEYITQVNSKSFVKVYVGNTAPFRYGEKLHAANNTTNFIANGVVFYIDGDYIDLELTEGTFPTTNNFSLKSLITTANTYISNAVPFTGSTTARGVVKDNIEDKLYVKRIQLDNTFQVNKGILGSLSGTTANVVNIAIDTDSDPVGLNAIINTKASTANGVISQVQIIDSGFGFSNDSEIEFTTSADDRLGVVSNIKGGVGTGTGFYRTAKGFLSDVSKLHDGDYYQEYSYDILSRIPLEKYATMFKKVMHTSGTRFFGSVLIDSLANTIVTVANSAIDITDDSPYTIQDRVSIDIVDRDEFFIEIRE